MPDKNVLDDYLAAALALHGVDVDESRLTQLRQQFHLLNSMAEHFIGLDYAADDEPAAVYRL